MVILKILQFPICKNFVHQRFNMKVEYSILALQVDKLYPPNYILKPTESIEDHLKYIETFIESCGWGVDEFMAEFNHQTNLIIKKSVN